MDNTLFDNAERLFAGVCTPEAVRAIEAGGESIPLWDALEQSGFVQALLSEDAGGAGLALEDVWPVMFSAGRHAVPLPFAQTMLARGWLHEAGRPLDHGSVTFAPFRVRQEGDHLIARGVHFGQVASWVLATSGDAAWLLPTDEARVDSCAGHGSLDADLTWSQQVAGRGALARRAAAAISELQAFSLAALIAGAADRVLEMTLDYANQRVQFGKPIGKFQALQQQISEMAELVFAARMASQMACQGGARSPSSALAQLAKARASQGVGRIVAVAHAVHGAIGVTHEYDLQLYTRRLSEWSRTGGGAGYWSQQLGQAALDSGQSAVDFIRGQLFGEPVL